MLEKIRGTPGEHLSLEEYLAEVGHYESRVSDRFNKLERMQHFEEPYDPSWQMFVAGNWDEALRLDELERANVQKMFADFTRQGTSWYRVRVVEFPITPYLQWEFHGLKLRVECGEHIRIAPVGALASYEANGPMPEALVVGSVVMYEILYNKNGAPCGSRRITDPEAIARSREEIEQLYVAGEDFMSFFNREIAHLPPPDVKSSSAPSAGS
ncbi:MAG: DUF6879 family protein [Pseudonocardiaceae bacterium]